MSRMKIINKIKTESTSDLSEVNMEIRASGIRPMIPAKMIREIPLPIPRSVICSPNQIKSTVPVVMESIANGKKYASTEGLIRPGYFAGEFPDPVDQELAS